LKALGDLSDLTRSWARGAERADQAAHTAASDKSWLDALALQYFQNSDVS
jgi:hypothetical protein